MSDSSCGLPKFAFKSLKEMGSFLGQTLIKAMPNKNKVK